MNKKYIILFLMAVLCGVKSQGCAYFTYKPSEYLVFKVYDSQLYKDADSVRMYEVCASWKRMACRPMSMREIIDVVYNWSIGKTKDLRKTGHSDNRFAEWMRSHPDVIDYMVIAKCNEELRESLNDAWYYPYPGDSFSTDLKRLMSEIKTRRKGKLRDKYTLQLVRAMKSLHQDRDIVNLWKSYKFKDGIMRKMTKEYVAGAYYAMGQYEEALELFGDSGDAYSIIWCLQALGRPADRLTVISTMAKNPANDYKVRSGLQDYVSSIMNSDDEKENCLKRLTETAHRLSRIVRPSSRGLWLYTEAFAEWELGRKHSALRLLKRAESMSNDRFMSNSIHAFRLIAEARLRPLDSSYDDFLLDAGKWFVGQAENEMKQLAKSEWWFTYDEICQYRNLNYSCIYFADMFRKMSMGQAVPRLMKQGRKLRALQLVDMADNLLIPPKEIRRINNHGGATFAMVDTLGANFTRSYVRLLHNPSDRYDRFYRKYSSSVNMDFWYDLTGTFMMRECRYAEAVKWLSKVANPDKVTENTLGWQDRNPFALELIYSPYCIQRNVLKKKTKNYKLWFARRMVALQHTYRHARNRNRRAEAKLEFAVGMHNSIYPCWPLTQYYHGGSPLDTCGDIGFLQKKTGKKDEYGFDEYVEVNRHQKEINRAFRQSSRLLRQAIAEITDKERVAQIWWTMGFYKTVKHHFSDTRFASIKRGHCDRWKDY